MTPTRGLAYPPEDLFNGGFHLTVPHDVPLRLGTLKSILKLVATHHELSVEELLNRLRL